MLGLAWHFVMWLTPDACRPRLSARVGSAELGKKGGNTRVYDMTSTFDRGLGLDYLLPH